MAALAYECNRAVKATTMDCCATSGIGIACGNRHPRLKIYFTIKLTLNLTLNVVKLKPKVFLKTSITLGSLFPEFTSNCPTSLEKWIFKSATTSTKTTATSEPVRSSKTVATTQSPTSSNNVEQAKEVEASSSHVPPWLVWSTSLFSGKYGRPVPRHFAKAPKRFLGSNQTMSKRLLLPVGDSRIAKTYMPSVQEVFLPQS
ncbi:hypothetical protein ILUMI_15062 [Ignelater luminosus]|uniref:Uncharacterized protein n=1 Tax=Ignelater luminosus TaxID=2038154 RepID=A0A8K0CT10_IGNLU|nr:hypothetical protein ILUMI_15062 [Ignelater luminosus]